MSKSDQWMPLYIAEYLADTGHLTTAQHGAYLLLIMHYWRKRELPDDDKQLAAIAKLPLRNWLDVKETIQMFFYEGWHHKRIEKELAHRDVVSTKRALAGSRRWPKPLKNFDAEQAIENKSAHKNKNNRKITNTVSEDTRLGEGEYVGSPEFQRMLRRMQQ